MLYFVYGRDAKTGEVMHRQMIDAADETAARAKAEERGMEVTGVVAGHQPAPAPDPMIADVRCATADHTRQRAEVADADADGDEAVAFKQTLDQLTPHTWVSYSLIGANVLVFVLMALGGADLINPTSAALVAWGAEFGPKTLAGEWWRLFTNQFVHIGFMHLVYNMIAFAYVGQTVERMIGNVNFLLLYLVSGVGGALLALHLNPFVVHAGASGAVFGVYGALLAFVFVQGRSIPTQVAASLRNLVLIFVAYNLIYSLGPGVSLAAHVGGLITGFVFGLILAQPVARASLAGRPLHGLVATALGLVLLGAGVSAVRAEYPALERLQQLRTQFYRLDAKDKAAFDKAHRDNYSNSSKYGTCLKQVRDFNDKAQMRAARQCAKTLDDAAFADLIEHDLLSDWRVLRGELEAYHSVPRRFSADFNAIVSYAKLRQEAWEQYAEGLRKTDESAIDAAEKIDQRADEARREFRHRAL